jgi:hypothetical protein
VLLKLYLLVPVPALVVSEIVTEFSGRPPIPPSELSVENLVSSMFQILRFCSSEKKRWLVPSSSPNPYSIQNASHRSNQSFRLTSVVHICLLSSTCCFLESSRSTAFYALIFLHRLRGLDTFPRLDMKEIMPFTLSSASPFFWVGNTLDKTACSIVLNASSPMVRLGPGFVSFLSPLRSL